MSTEYMLVREAVVNIFEFLDWGLGQDKDYKVCSPSADAFAHTLL